MEVSSWDTYVERKDGKEMRFGILVPSELTDLNKILEYGLNYIQSKPFATWGLSSNKCNFCHVEQRNDKEFLEKITQKGYAIVEMENCN